MTIGGYCLVQGDCYIGRENHDAYAYFRARGRRWSVEIWEDPKIGGHRQPFFEFDSLPDGDPTWFVWAPWGTWPDAGWMDRGIARDLFEQMVAAYVAGWPGEPA